MYHQLCWFSQTADGDGTGQLHGAGRFRVKTPWFQLELSEITHGPRYRRKSVPCTEGTLRVVVNISGVVHLGSFSPSLCPKGLDLSWPPQAHLINPPEQKSREPYLPPFNEHHIPTHLKNLLKKDLWTLDLDSFWTNSPFSGREWEADKRSFLHPFPGLR